MELGPYISDFPYKTSIHRGFPSTMFDETRGHIVSNIYKTYTIPLIMYIYNYIYIYYTGKNICFYFVTYIQSTRLLAAQTGPLQLEDLSADLSARNAAISALGPAGQWQQALLVLQMLDVDLVM